jgi:hypothetical protein
MSSFQSAALTDDAPSHHTFILVLEDVTVTHQQCLVSLFQNVPAASVEPHRAADVPFAGPTRAVVAAFDDAETHLGVEAHTFYKCALL